jgi:hypothetical protein
VKFLQFENKFDFSALVRKIGMGILLLGSKVASTDASFELVFCNILSFCVVVM